ncbi:non-homologous end joining protein Ku [Occallatibacter riparius]|uniref:Non-homologous end joining protein Ku n=1 Tax=Occallatibacter riparius TaxID=1002689 RepID=A0A9J7BUK5_9BACT|nr:Ku protein [Occallatibacter riparius]UWZ86555.1 Ku protein [Occallatibacter riparius]
MARPFWSGQIQISLVSFGVKLFPATEAKSEIHFHQISKKTGERVRHQKVSGGASGDEEPVEKDDIVKGYEYSKGEYVQIDPKEIANLRIPSRRTLELQQFVDLKDLDPAYFEKPYFVTPENESQAEAFATVRKALADTHKAGLGKIAMSGREHVIAISAPEDDSLPGLMGYELRYAEELRKPEEYFADIKTQKISEESLDLAKELIKRKSGKFEMEKFKDEYEAALRAMIEAKMKNVPLPKEEKPAKRGKVIDLMDALRASIGEGGKKPPAHESAGHGKAKSKVAVMPRRGAKKSSEKRRKSA